MLLVLSDCLGPHGTTKEVIIFQVPETVSIVIPLHAFSGSEMSLTKESILALFNLPVYKEIRFRKIQNYNLTTFSI